MGIDAGYKGTQAVIVFHEEVQFQVGGKLDQGITAGLVLCIGVDIGIVPEQIRTYPLTPQSFQALDGAGGAAGMEKEFHRNLACESDWLICV
jgi:hypothetical protein